MPSPPEGSEWRLVGDARQTLLLQDGHVSGSGGCNRFAGAYVLDGELLTFESLASTRMACEPDVMQAESYYFAALERTARFRIDDGQLLLLEGTGTEVLQLISTAATRPQEPPWS